MSLIEKGLFETVDRVQIAIERLQAYEGLALQMHPDGFFVADSGGKDSGAIVHLAKLAGVKHTCHYHPTTIDPPELVRFLRRKRPETIFGKPSTNMWDLIVKKGMPPTRLARYCCAALKEHGGAGRFVVTGIRWQESTQRKGRQMVEACRMPGANRRLIHPIVDWTEADVWQLHKDHGVPYCELYDEGFKRLGCIGCPMGRRKQMEAQFKRWPHYKKLYIRAFDRCIAKRESNRTVSENWPTGQAMFDWWLGIKETEEGDNGPLFGWGS